VLLADDEEVYHLPAGDSLLERIRDLYGEEVATHLRPLTFGNGVVEIGGFAGVPPFSRLDREWQVIFINGRPAGSPIVNYAIQNAYRSVLAGGRYAPLFLCIDLPAEMVDVNVHPAKKEVRFRRPTEVRDVIIEAIRLAISGPDLPGRQMPERAKPPVAFPAPHAPSAPPPPSSALPAAPPAPVAHIQPRLDWTPPPVPDAPASEPGDTPWGRYRVLGRVGGGVVVLETDAGLVLMDPRSAHERVLYERLLGAIEKGAVPSQGLLPPVTIQPSPAQCQTLRRHLELLTRMGFGVAEFGTDTFMVDALPVWLAEADPAPLLSDIADGLMQGGKGRARDWARPIIATIAGQQAVGLRRELTDAELHALIRDLARTEMPYTSPRGKPTVILFSTQELNRKFGRD
ncbi:MAG: hypothetical protein PHO14_09035, partial [Kiritimatiellae bacterium]|nr:hypothetical protein [Kiritimatiellia bacterium]